MRRRGKPVILSERDSSPDILRNTLSESLTILSARSPTLTCF